MGVSEYEFRKLGRFDMDISRVSRAVRRVYARLVLRFAIGA